jgi:hypothetical protein
MNSTYAIHHLPQKLDNSFTRKFAALYREATRTIFPDEELILQANYLLTTPEALHAMLHDQHWVLCIAPNAISGATTLDEGQWVGIYAVLGPFQTTESGFFESDTPALSTESLWNYRRVYLQEQHRKHEAISGMHKAAEAYIRERHQTAGFETGHARVRFFAKDGSAMSALHSANAGQTTLIRSINYDEILRGDGSIARLPPAVVTAAPARVLEVPWKLFETIVEC